LLMADRRASLFLGTNSDSIETLCSELAVMMIKEHGKEKLKQDFFGSSNGEKLCWS
jgi:hypothetical protein